MLEVFKMLEGCYDQATILPRYTFNPELPEEGHCGVTAMCVEKIAYYFLQTRLEIWKGMVKGFRHYINYDPATQTFYDLTAAQFGVENFASKTLPPNFKNFAPTLIKDLDTMRRCDILYKRFCDKIEGVDTWERCLRR